MTISYSKDISDGQGLKGIFMLFLRWKGSLYKLLWVDLIIYVSCYYTLNLIYRFALSEESKRTFEEIVKFCDSMKNTIPLSFLLGFFVAGIITRWWQMYLAIPWLDKLAFLMQGIAIGNGSEKSRTVRLLFMRYLNLSWILLMRRISEQIQIRFQISSNSKYNLRQNLMSLNQDKKIKATFKKIITNDEISAFERISEAKFDADEKRSRNKKYEPEYWIPLHWTVRLLQKCYIHGYVSDIRTANKLIEEIEELRKQMQLLQNYSQILIPLVYTQVVVIAVYSYFVIHLMAAQFLDPKQNIKGHKIDFYFPINTIFQFLFLVGWLKVAMCVMNPFGDDDEDFQTSEMLDYNLDLTFRSASAEDLMYPELLKPAAIKFRKQDNHEEDNFEIFLDADNKEVTEQIERQSKRNGMSSLLRSFSIKKNDRSSVKDCESTIGKSKNKVENISKQLFVDIENDQQFFKEHSNEINERECVLESSSAQSPSFRYLIARDN